MKKKLFILILLVLFLPAFLFAQRVFDYAEILSGAEKENLERQLAEIASRYSFDLAILTITDAGNFNLDDLSADDLNADEYGDGCIFLQVTESRDYRFLPYGRGEKILNNTAYGKIDSDILRFLKNDDYTGAYRAYADNWEKFLELEANGRNYNFFYRWNALLVIIAWVIASLIGFLVVQSWKAQMDTAVPKKEADPYVVSGSLAFTSKKESFLYSNVTKTKRQTQTASAAKIHGGKY